MKAAQLGLTVGDLDGEVDAAVDQEAEAFEVGQLRTQGGEFVRTDVAGAATHLVCIAELPIGPGAGDRILVLTGEGAGAHRADGREGGLRLGQLPVPPGELGVVHVRRCWSAARPRQSRAPMETEVFAGNRANELYV